MNTKIDSFLSSNPRIGYAISMALFMLSGSIANYRNDLNAIIWNGLMVVAMAILLKN